jgi:hypothetical protein
MLGQTEFTFTEIAAFSKTALKLLAQPAFEDTMVAPGNFFGDANRSLVVEMHFEGGPTGRRILHLSEATLLLDCREKK